MKTSARSYAIMGGVGVTLLLLGVNAGRLGAKEKNSTVNPNDPTVRLYSLLDSKYNGKVDSFCVLADVVSDPKNPGQQQQHVLRLEYNKDHGFGKLSIHMRTVAQLTPEQLKTYSPQQIYDFGETDSAKFTKTDPGSFGRPGDVYFEASPDGGPLQTAPVTSEVQAQYDQFITQYLMPALEKKAAGGSGS